MKEGAPKQENAIDSSREKVLERGGNAGKTSVELAMERAELIAKDAEGQKEDAAKIEELSKKIGVDLSKSVGEKEAKAKTLEEKNQEAMKEFFTDKESTLVKNYDNDGKEIVDVEKPKTDSEKNQEAMKEFFTDKESTLVKNYDNDGKEIVDAVLDEKPKETPEARKGVMDPKVQMEALDDFVKGLKKETPESKKNKKNWRGFIKERLKGFFTAGYMEFSQANRFRSGTKEEVKALQEDMKGIDANTKRTANLSEADAYEEAGRMQELAKEDGKKWESKSISKEDLNKFSEITTQEKVAQNSAYIETIIAGSTARLAKRLEKYKNQWGESVFTEEKTAAFQDKIRDKLQLMQEATVENNPHKAAFGANTELLKKNIRESFDKNYWVRNIYGGIDLALIGVLVKFGAAYLGAKSIHGTAEVVRNVATSSVDKVATNLPSLGDKIPMHDNVWTTAKELAGKIPGLENLTNTETYNLTHAMCGDNGIGVELWNQVGSPMDTGMLQGHGLNIGEGFKKALEAVMHARGV